MTAALALFSCSGKQVEPIQLTSEADLSGLCVGVTAGSCYDIYLSDWDNIVLQRYMTSPDVLQALQNGKIDTVLEDEIVFDAVTRKEQGIKIAIRGDISFPTAFVFPKDKPYLVMACDDVLRRMEADGRMKQLKDYWLEEAYVESKEVPLTFDLPSEGDPLVVVTSSSTAPISYLVNGEWYGLEVDLMRALAKELNRPLEIRLYDVASAFIALETGMADVMMGCIFVTEERQERFLFSKPYHFFHGAYFVRDEEALQHDSGFWSGQKDSFRRNLLVEQRWKFIAAGLWETIKISILAILLGSVLGLGLYKMTISRRKWLRSVASGYNWFIAGIPQLVLLLILFYVIFAKSSLSPTTVSIIAFALTFASGASDIYKTSLEAIPYGQTEAGLALGFTRLQTFRHIIFPQAVRRGLPLFSSQCVSLLKGTSIVGYIAIQDITRAGDIIRSRTFDAFLPLVMVTVIYFVLAWLLGVLLQLALPKKNVL